MVEKKIEVNGTKLFIREMGDKKPTVIFESAMGMSLNCWLSIQREISKITHTISYDRACNGKSQFSSVARNVRNIAKELHMLLHALDARPPFILVGASYGGYIVRTYASLYGEEIAGVVFVEPSHEDFSEEVKKIRTMEEWKELQELTDQIAGMSTDGYKEEWKNFPEDSDYVRNLTIPDHIPTTVISSARYGSVEQWVMKLKANDIVARCALQKQLLTSHSASEQIITVQAGHDVVAEEPGLVITAIKDLINYIHSIQRKGGNGIYYDEHNI